jgi:hypothetical protein
MKTMAPKIVGRARARQGSWEASGVRFMIDGHEAGRFPGEPM